MITSNVYTHIIVGASTDDEQFIWLLMFMALCGHGHANITFLDYSKDAVSERFFDDRSITYSFRDMSVTYSMATGQLRE